ncbi:hypothetical protein FB567DRAFT_598715 [Paraphoma chrysanthemicola]|uniref:DUF6594 domain-containing protein n=1 Tax=Paraphoma chrysanthemicola TaxID=798071 RepID=A0A8K0QTL9_9PLEO|nr:hypothetical protein FB567DRAFT_598715 [Paraphoma chrysanthemicola]
MTQQQFMNIEDYPRGYPRLAAFQSSDDDFIAFRRFATVHTRCLLLAQDEILSLERELQRLDGAERVQLYLSSREHDANPARLAILKELRVKLREYDKDLLRYLQLSSARRPRPANLESLKKWMKAVKPLIREETRFLDQSEDFVTIERDVEEGALEFMVEKFARTSRIGNLILKSTSERRKSADPHLHFYSAARKGLLVRLLLTGLASFLLLVPTILLYELENLRARLVVIAIFIALFAVAVALLTRARRHEIFASTAA